MVNGDRHRKNPQITDDGFYKTMGKCEPTKLVPIILEKKKLEKILNGYRDHRTHPVAPNRCSPLPSDLPAGNRAWHTDRFYKHTEMQKGISIGRGAKRR